jgi:hypothetical protein
MDEEICEAALADEEILKRVRADKSIKLAYGSTKSGYSPLSTPLFDLDRVWKLIEGSIDFHVHSYPDAYNTRLLDELDLAIEAIKLGMRAMAFKCASGFSVRSALVAQKAANQWAEAHNKKSIDLFGGVVLNYCVGGLNPEAVLASYRMGGKFVWLPNRDASFHHKVLGTPGGIDVLDENDKVVPELKEIFAMIAEGDMILSLCHQGTKERFIMIDEAKKTGVKKIEVCHPNQVTAKMTVEQMKIAADKGAYIGYYCTRFRPLQWSWDEFMQVYETVGPDHIIATTDNGHFEAPSPADSMRMYVAGMLLRGVPEKDVAKMISTNPAKLLYEDS